MTIFKKQFTMLILLVVVLLTGCMSQGNPVYVDSILVYENGELLTGNYKYYDGDQWVDYDETTSTTEKIYYSVSVKAENIRVIFNIYAPNTTLNELKILTNSNLYYSNNNTLFINYEITQNGNIFVCPYEFEFTNEFNAITVTGFSTSNGLKYMGSKDKESNFVLYGIHLNLISD